MPKKLTCQDNERGLPYEDVPHIPRSSGYPPTQANTPGWYRGQILSLSFFPTFLSITRGSPGHRRWNRLSFFWRLVSSGLPEQPCVQLGFRTLHSFKGISRSLMAMMSTFQDRNDVYLPRKSVSVLSLQVKRSPLSRGVSSILTWRTNKLFCEIFYPITTSWCQWG